MNDSEMAIDLSVLEIIYSATLPIYYRLYSLLEDVFNKRVLLSETDTAVLLDFCSCAATLKILFEEFFERTAPAKPDEKIKLSKEEFTTIMSLSKTVELSTRTTFSGLSIQDH